MKSSTPDPASQPVAAGEPLDILLVDDDPDVRQTVARLLERHGHAVHEAGNGIVALRLLQEKRFSLIVTDVVMPDMEGLEFVRRVRRMAEPPRVVVMSGGGRGDASQYLTLAERFGADAVIAKPFSAQALAEVIGRALNGGP